MDFPSNELLDVAIIGAGHAGLSMSYLLKTQDLKHIVFERSRIGETWRSQRWNSFTLNTANARNILPGQTYTGNDPEGYSSAGLFIEKLEAYVKEFQLPVSERSWVTAIDKQPDQPYFTITVSKNGNLFHFQSKQIVIASGGQNVKLIPAHAENIAPTILQLHTADYRSPQQLPEGNVLVVSSAQSGCQIAEDLADAGRTVFLSTSRVGRYPRRYRGKDIIEWLLMMNHYDFKTEDLTDPHVLSNRVPVVSGLGPLGHTLSLQSLAKKGVIILGKLEYADDTQVYFGANAEDHVKYADQLSQKTKASVDEFILENKMDAPDPEINGNDLPDEKASCASTILSINLKEQNIQTIIWATGFIGDFSYIRLPVCDKEGNLKHKNGVSDINGLYFLGLPWQRKRKSAIVFGIKEDAEFILNAVLDFNANKNV